MTRVAVRGPVWSNGSVPEGTVLGRAVGGGVAALTAGEASALLGGVYLANITWPQVVAHRFGAYGAGESTLESAEIALAAGCKVLETDFMVTGDGVAILNHDATLDRTTTATGTPATFTYGQIFNAVMNDPATYLSASGYPAVKVPTVEQLLNRVRGRAVVFLEEKSALTAPQRAALSARWAALGAQQFVVIQSFTQSVCEAWIALGWQTMYLTGSAVADPVAMRAAGHRWLGYGYPTVGDAAIASAKAAGLRVATWTHSTRASVDAPIAAGADAPMTDHPAHCIRVASWPGMASVGFASNVFPPGIIGDAGVGVSLSSGRLTPGPGTVGTVGEGGVLLGPLGPITATDFTVTVTQQLTNAGTWVGLAIQGPSDIGYKQAPGYMAIWRTNGTMDVYRYNSSGGPTSIGSVAGGSYAYGEDKSISIRITPTQVIATPVGSGQSVTINDTTYRPASWHVHACRNNGGANSILSAAVS